MKDLHPHRRMVKKQKNRVKPLNMYPRKTGGGGGVVYVALSDQVDISYM